MIEIIFNPEILPTQEEWKLICEMVKQQRELTDEEIDKVWAETCSDFKLIENGKTKGIINIYDVSRAILKKASEK
jgi:carbonic anhydrase